MDAGAAHAQPVRRPGLAEQRLAQPLTEEQSDIAMKNELTTAKLAWQPRLYDPQLRKWLHRIDVPTLIVWGDGDKSSRRPMARRISG